MRTIRVETSAATILLTEAPEPKVRDRQTGEIAKDATSGEALMTLGAPVSLPGLVARPWESVFNGQQRHGIAYRAAAVTPAAFPAATGAAA